MTGNDLIFWLEDLWFDLWNPGTTNIFWLGFRLLIVFVVLRLLYGMIERPLKNSKRKAESKASAAAFARRRKREQKEQEKNRAFYEQQEAERQEQQRLEAEEKQRKAQEEKELILKTLSLDD